ncbi:MED14-domain-containing protein [Patellaria atrata CBS 101060]|uniref:Mediator of RNA polymerase II transcription subunit 14 n=1 Tax=Patellaria atrata CBS 101060 TaxID=1346257 RepID=A0A9P4S4I4_9PEZI|nr:MED14-domain-containing protein [Patellaria atrata CBS 101060]
MPGRIIMEQNGANGAISEKPSSKSTVNGPSDLRNGAFVNGATPHGAGGSPPEPSSFSQLPPKISRLADEDFRPLSVLLTRTVQECFNDLGTTIEEMAAIPVPPQPRLPMTNGAGNMAVVNGNGNMSEPNVTKKVKMMEFANHHRERFIKLLVLSQWAKHSGDVRSLIDLSIWLRSQVDMMTFAAQSFGNLKLEMHSAQVPNPDIQTALEVLSTGQASWLPDLGYLPPDPLTPERILKVLQDMNAILSIRINLHEELPHHLTDWSIGSGRATFRVPTEFELDVSVAGEEPSSPFFFIDIRLTFTPTPEKLDGPLLTELEHRANGILEKSGLSGCYDFFHNFVLTHKLSILRKQAYEMSMGAWADTIRVESIHRSVIVQYWTDFAHQGRKNWLEIGISSGRSKIYKSWKALETPKIGLRWWRDGVEVKDVDVTIDWGNLSMENILTSIIDLHIKRILGTIKSTILQSSGNLSSLIVDVSTPTSNTADSELELQLCTSTCKFKGAIVHTTGRFALRPLNQVSVSAENQINALKDISLDAPTKLTGMLCMHLQVSIVKESELYGWKKLGNINIRTDAIRTKLKTEIVTYAFFRIRGWTSNWVIAATINLSGDSWWVIELDDASVGGSIITAHPLPNVSSTNETDGLSPTFFHKVERHATASLSFHITSQELRKRRVPHTLQMEPVPVTVDTEDKDGFISIPTMYIKFSSLMKGTAKPWASEYLRLSHLGFEPQQGKVVHIVRGMMINPKIYSQLVSNARDENVSFKKNGAFSVTMKAPLGVPFIDQLKDRLKGIERLRTFAEVMKREKLRCDKINLGRIIFRYADNLTADINFAEASQIKVDLSPDNPHRRIAIMLDKVLNDPTHGFEYFIRILSVTLPVVRACDAAEQNSQSSSTQCITHPRNVQWFRIKYRNPQCFFDLQLRNRRDALEWHLDDPEARTGVKPASARPDDLAAALKDLFRGHGEKWWGLRTGLYAGVDGIYDAILRVDDVVRGFAIKAKDPEIVELD